jgi:hypothetical protein
MVFSSFEILGAQRQNCDVRYLALAGTVGEFEAAGRLVTKIKSISGCNLPAGRSELLHVRPGPIQSQAQSTGPLPGKLSCLSLAKLPHSLPLPLHWFCHPLPRLLPMPQQAVQAAR